MRKMKVTKVMFLTLILSLAACQSPQKSPLTNDLLRPELLIEFEEGASDINNIKPISEAVFSLLESGSSQVLLATSTSDSPSVDTSIAYKRMLFLSNALKNNGIPEYKIKKIVRWNGKSNDIEVYGLKQGWQGLPFDMLHFGFVPKPINPSVIIQTKSANYKEPKKVEVIDNFLVKKGSFKRVMNELVKAAKWKSFYLHTKDFSLPNSYTISLQEMPLPLNQDQIESVIRFILKNEGVENLNITVYVDEKTIAISENI